MKKKRKLVYGVGINDSNYPVTWLLKSENEANRSIMVTCPIYIKWRAMLERCYSPRLHKTRPNYIGCSVCEEWHLFSNFKAWMETQDWEGKQLDKDLLVAGNKVYSPETCIFIDAKLNIFLTETRSNRGEYMTGVSWEKSASKFKSVCGDGAGKQTYLGLFGTEIEAHLAWLSYKKERAKLLAEEQINPVVAKALIERYEKYHSEEALADMKALTDKGRLAAVYTEIKQFKADMDTGLVNNTK